MVFGPTISIIVIIWHSAQATEREVHPHIMQYKNSWSYIEVLWIMEEDGVPIVPVDLKDRRESCPRLNPRKSEVVYIRWWKTSCPNARSIDLSWCMQDGVEEALHGGRANYFCMSNDPDYHQYSTWVSLVYGVQPCGEGELQAVHNHNFPCAVCYICFSEGCRHSDVVSSFKSILTNIFKAAAILLWKQNKCVHTLNVYSVWQYIWRMNSKWFSILGTEQQSEIVWCIHGGSHSVQYQFPMHKCPCLPPKYSIPKCPNAQYSMPSSKLLKHHRHTYLWHKVCCIRTYKWVPPF